MKKKEQIINPLIRFRQKAQGRYANRISGTAHGRAISLDETRCFYIVSAEIGRPDPNATIICFNTEPNVLSCGVVSVTDGFSFKVDSVDIAEQSYLDQPSTNCLNFRTRNVVSGDGITPDQDVTYSYSQGTCHKEGDSDPECVLEEATDVPVRNSILGILAARVGDIADNVVVVRLGHTAAVIGLNWVVRVGITTANITSSQIVNGNIQLTIDVTVNPGDVVTVSHTSTTNGAQATDGRFLYEVQNYSVVNATGVDYWILENTEAPRAWVTEGMSRWKLG